MTVANSAVYDNCIFKAFSGTTYAWPAHASHGAATAGQWSMLLTSQASVAKATDATYGASGPTNQVANGNGYASGGYDMVTSAAALSGNSPNTVPFIATGTSSWTAATFSTTTAIFQYVPTYTTPTATANPLWCYNDLTGATGTAQTVTSGTLTLTWAGTGVMIITISAAA